MYDESAMAIRDFPSLGHPAWLLLTAESGTAGVGLEISSAGFIYVILHGQSTHGQSTHGQSTHGQSTLGQQGEGSVRGAIPGPDRQAGVWPGCPEPETYPGLGAKPIVNNLGELIYCRGHAAVTCVVPANRIRENFRKAHACNAVGSPGGFAFHGAYIRLYHRLGPPKRVVFVV